MNIILYLVGALSVLLLVHVLISHNGVGISSSARRQMQSISPRIFPHQMSIDNKRIAEE